MSGCGDDDLALRPCVEAERHMFMCVDGQWVSTASMPPAPAFKFQQQTSCSTSPSLAFNSSVNWSRQTFGAARTAAPVSSAAVDNDLALRRGCSQSSGGPRMASTPVPHADWAPAAQCSVFGYCDGRPVFNFNQTQSCNHGNASSSPPVGFQQSPFGVQHMPYQPPGRPLTPLPRPCGDLPSLDDTQQDCMRTTQQGHASTLRGAQGAPAPNQPPTPIPTPAPAAAPAVAPGNVGQSKEAAGVGLTDLRGSDVATKQFFKKNDLSQPSLAGFPLGPWSNIDDAQYQLYTWATNPSTGCGGFCMVENGSRSRVRRKYRCSDCGPAGAGMWALEIEETSSGWVPVSINNSHKNDHPLKQTMAEAMAQRNGMTFHPEIAELGRFLGAGHLTASEMAPLFEQKAKEIGIPEPYPWDYSAIYDKFVRNQNSEALDTQGLVELLQKRYDEQGLAFFLTVDDSSRLDKLFWVIDGAVQFWALGGQSNVLLFDPTHGTNRHRLKLAAFTSVSQSGKTVILAVCLIKHEDEQSFEWCFRSFARVFRLAPRCFFTDGDLALAQATEAVAKDVWTGVIHLLCVFHIFKNFYQHLRNSFVDNTSGWRKLVDIFWSIAKSSDEHLDMEEMCDELLQFYESNASGPKKSHGTEWLMTLVKRVHQWAAHYVWALNTWGIFSTQRAESMQKTMKGFLRSNSLLTTVYTKITDHSRRAVDLHASDDVNKMLRQGALMSALPPMIKRLIGNPPRISPFAIDLLISQSKQALMYKSTLLLPDVEGDDEYMVTRLPDSTSQPAMPQLDEQGYITCFTCDDDFGVASNDGDLNIGRYTTLTRCSCQYLKAWGVPCRHIIHLYITLQREDFPFNLIGTKWVLVNTQVQQEAYERLLKTPVKTYEHQAPQSRESKMSRADRIAVSWSFLRPLSDLCAESDHNFLTIRMHSLDIAAHVQNSNERPSLLLRGAEKTTSSRDFESMRSALGVIFQQSRCPFDDVLAFRSTEGKRLVNRHIAYKWAKKGRGGWCIGVIKRQLFADEDTVAIPNTLGVVSEHNANFEVHYDCDNETVAHALLTQNFATNAECDIHFWLLLEDRDYSYVPPVVLNPSKKREPGRHQSVRKKATHGPTS